MRYVTWHGTLTYLLISILFQIRILRVRAARAAGLQGGGRPHGLLQPPDVQRAGTLQIHQELHEEVQPGPHCSHLHHPWLQWRQHGGRPKLQLKDSNIFTTTEIFLDRLRVAEVYRQHHQPCEPPPVRLGQPLLLGAGVCAISHGHEVHSVHITVDTLSIQWT